MTVQCEACKTTTAMPTHTAHHLHLHRGRQYPLIDFGEWSKIDFLVLVDAFSKWPEVNIVSSTTTQKTIKILC